MVNGCYLHALTPVHLYLPTFDYLCIGNIHIFSFAVDLTKQEVLLLSNGQQVITVSICSYFCKYITVMFWWWILLNMYGMSFAKVSKKLFFQIHLVKIWSQSDSIFQIVFNDNSNIWLCFLITFCHFAHLMKIFSVRLWMSYFCQSTFWHAFENKCMLHVFNT